MVKRSLSLALAVAACATSLIVAAEHSQAAPPVQVFTDEAWPGAKAASVVVASDSTLVQAHKEMQEVAPKAFALDGNSVFIYDTLGGSIRTYAAGKLKRVTKVPFMKVRDLAVKGTTATVLEAGNKVRTLRIGAAKAKQLSRTTVKGASITQLRLAGAALVAESADGRSIALNPARTHTVGSLSAAPFDPIVDQADGYLITNPNGTKTKITLTYDPIHCSKLCQGGGFTYYQVSEWHSTDADGWVIGRYVFQIADSGQVVNTYTLDDSRTSIPRRFVQVVNGGVYQLAVNGASTKVLRLMPDVATSAPRVDISAAADESGSQLAPANTVAPAAAPRTKIAVVQRAKALRNFKWTYSAAKNGDKSVISAAVRKKVAQPHYLRGKKTAKVTGYPYTWGGYDSDKTTSSQKWKNFTAGLKQKKYTGNVSNASGGYAPGTIGLDCSGFISTVFEVGKKRSTESLIDGKLFRKSNAKPAFGDIFNRAGKHVMLVVGTRYVNHALWIDVMEATTDEQADKVVSNRYLVDGLIQRGYRTGVYSGWSYRCGPGVPCPVSVGR